MQKAGQDKFIHIHLTVRLVMLEAYWERILKTNDNLMAFKNIESIDYYMQDMLKPSNILS
jgi:hypothetical protein